MVDPEEDRVISDTFFSDTFDFFFIEVLNSSMGFNNVVDGYSIIRVEEGLSKLSIIVETAKE